MALKIPLSLEYNALMEASRQKTADPTLRLLICAEASSEPLVPLLTALFAEQGVGAHVEVSACTHPEQLVGFTPSKPPTHLCLLPAVQELAVRHRVRCSAQFPQEEAERWLAAAEAFRQRSPCQVLLADYPQWPIQGDFWRGRDPQSLAQAITAINSQWHHFMQDQLDYQLVSLQQLALDKGAGLWDERLWHAVRLPCALEQLGHYAWQIVRAALLASRPVKLVAVDFDNTLWGGEIGDRQPQELELGAGGAGEPYLDMQFFLKELAQAGIMLAGCSRNLPAVALSAFEHEAMLLKPQDFAMLEISPRHKTESLLNIQRQANVACEDIVFLDDSPFERQMVKDLLPGVIVPELPKDPALRVSYLRGLSWHDGRGRKLSPERNAQLQDNQRRQEQRASHASEDDFLRSLAMRARIRPCTPSHLERVHELFQRTNQYNFSGKRYLHAQLTASLQDLPARCWQMELQDSFGSYGLIAAAMLERVADELRVENFVMSCRVAARGVESFFLNHLKQLAEQEKMARLVVDYLPTERNVHCQKILRDNHFQQDGRLWKWHSGAGLSDNWITHEP